MKILSSKTFNAQVQESIDLKKSITALNAQVQELYGSILTWQESVQNYRGNKYNTYESALAAANSMYIGTADWGVNQFGAAVGARASFIMPRGFKLVAKKNADEELAFANNFVNFNDLPKENAMQFIIESEIEGKILLALVYDDKTEFIDDKQSISKTGMVSVRFISQVSNPYKIITDPLDYMLIKNAEYTINGETEPRTIEEKYFIYRKFGGRMNQPNETSSRVLKCLTQIENLDRALRDFRELDHLFAVPIPANEVETAEEATDNAAAMDKTNWKPGKMFFHRGKFSFQQPTLTGAEMLYKEIVVLAEMISFNTGIPVHYWFPELATNRATADDISFGLVFSSTVREREIWRGLLEELIDKAIVFYNEKNNTTLRQGMIKVEIPVITKDDLARLETFWLRALSEEAITQKTFLSHVPDIDVDAELEALQEDKDEAFEKMKSTGIFDEKPDDENNDGGNENVGNQNKEKTNPFQKNQK
jgi:hypothetical protein